MAVPVAQAELLHKFDELKSTIALIALAKRELATAEKAANDIVLQVGVLDEATIEEAYAAIGDVDWQVVEAAADQIRMASQPE